jgi:hypothetical protein
VIGPGLPQGEQELGHLDEADAVAGAAGAVAERLCKPALADPDRAAKDHVLLRGEPVEPEQLAHTGAIVVHGGLPDEVLVGDDLVEAGGLHPVGQALAVAAVDLVLEQELEELERAELGLARVRRPVGQRGHEAAEAQALEATQ